MTSRLRSSLLVMPYDVYRLIFAVPPITDSRRAGTIGLYEAKHPLTHPLAQCHVD
jgi:hypothetical protein